MGGTASTARLSSAQIGRNPAASTFIGRGAAEPHQQWAAPPQMPPGMAPLSHGSPWFPLARAPKSLGGPCRAPEKLGFFRGTCWRRLPSGALGLQHPVTPITAAHPRRCGGGGNARQGAQQARRERDMATLRAGGGTAPHGENGPRRRPLSCLGNGRGVAIGGLRNGSSSTDGAVQCSAVPAPRPHTEVAPLPGASSASFAETHTDEPLANTRACGGPKTQDPGPRTPERRLARGRSKIKGNERILSGDRRAHKRQFAARDDRIGFNASEFLDSHSGAAPRPPGRLDSKGVVSASICQSA